MVIKARNVIRHYVNYDVIRPLCIRLPQMIGYVKHFDSSQTMSFKVSDKKLLKVYIKIWEKISGLINIEFDSKPLYGIGNGNKYIKTKLRSCGGEINTNFHNGEKKSTKRRLTMQVSVIDNARFC